MRMQMPAHVCRSERRTQGSPSVFSWESVGERSSMGASYRSAWPPLSSRQSLSLAPRRWKGCCRLPSVRSTCCWAWIALKRVRKTRLLPFSAFQAGAPGVARGQLSLQLAARSEAGSSQMGKRHEEKRSVEVGGLAGSGCTVFSFGPCCGP